MDNSNNLFNQGSIYEYAESYEYLIPTFSAISIGALAGAKIAGVHGALIGGTVGGVLGITDEALIHYRVTSKHYLTTAVLGAGMMNSFRFPYYIGEGIGFVIGIVAPTGYLTNFSVAMPTVVTAALVTQYTREKFLILPYATLYGAMAGATISLIDEALIYCNITKSYYLSATVRAVITFDFMASKFNNVISWGTSFFKVTQNLYNSATSLVNNIPYASLGIGMMFGVYIANKTESSISDWKPIALGEDLIKTYEKVVDKKVLEKRVEMFAIKSLAIQILLYNIALR